MTNGESVLFKIGVDPRGVRAKRVSDFINYWTTTDLDLDIAFRRHCRVNDMDEMALRQAFYYIKEKAISNNEMVAHLFKLMTCDEFITVLAHMSIN